VSAYTLVQLVELLIFGLVLLYGVLAHRPSIVILGGGLLVGKALLNILAPEGGSLYRRSLVAYGVAGVYVVASLVLARLLG
jgi:hypothetical protein